MRPTCPRAFRRRAGSSVRWTGSPPGLRAELRGTPVVLVAFLALSLACGPSEPVAESVLLAYIANAGSNNVQVVDLETGETLRKIYAGITPWRLVPAPDGRSLWAQHWFSETTAVIDLADHEVRATLPVRGPGTFDASGGRFLSFSWPGSALTVWDATTSSEPLETRTTEVSRVYDVALSEGGEDLFMVRYDPLAPGQRERFSYLVSLAWTSERPAPVSVPTGLSPVDVLTVPGQPFLLTADSAGDRLTLLNIHGDGRTVRTCPGPRRLLLSDDARRLVVLCWDREAGRRGRAVSYRTEFDARPWPRFVEEAAVELDAGPVAGAVAPGGERIWIVDQPGRRLLELDAEELRVERAVATGEVPSDVVLMSAPPSWRQRLRGQGDSRRRALEALARVRSLGAPFQSLRWTETLTWVEPPPEEDAEPGATGDLLEDPGIRSRRIEMVLAAPARVRRQARDDTVSLSAGSWSMTVRSDGRFWTAPRQELLSLLYALPNFEVEDALRRLAGDLPGSPYLAGGLAMDLVTEVEEGDRRYVLLGALEPGQPVAQLWLDAETGRPANLIEKFPAGAARAHAGSPIGRFVETKFYDFVTLEGGVTLPARLERILGGRWRQDVYLEQPEVDPQVAELELDLLRLGGFAAVESSGGPGAADGDPGRAVPLLEHGYLEHPWAEHPGYTSSPPTSGPRLRSLADWGVHPLPVPAALQVHNLEHGGVAVQYSCSPVRSGSCRDLVAQLTRLTEPYERVIVAPYPFMDARIALTAWGRIDFLEAFDEGRILAFLEAWHGRDQHGSAARSEH